MRHARRPDLRSFCAALSRRRTKIIAGTVYVVGALGSALSQSATELIIARFVLGIAVGTALLAVVNVIRIISLYHVIARWPDKFEVVHAELWPLAMVAIAFVAFLRWARWVEALDAPA